MKHTNQVIGQALIASMMLFAGCSKELNEQAASPSTKGGDSSTQSEIVVTPLGPLPKSKIHEIDSGCSASIQNGHLVEVDAKTGRLVKDYGLQSPVKYDLPSAFKTAAVLPGKTEFDVTSPNLYQGWQLNQENVTPFSNYSYNITASWLVPPLPVTNTSNSLIYMYLGTTAGDNVVNVINVYTMQTVLQYGNNYYVGGGTGNQPFGGNYWTVANWYSSCQGCDVITSTPVQVQPGTRIIGSIREDTTHLATATLGIKYPDGSLGQNSSLSLNNAPFLSLASVTMHAYNIQKVSDYPASPVDFYDIQGESPLVYFSGRGTPPPTPPFPFNWQYVSYKGGTPFGEHATVVSPSEIEFYFHQ